MEEVDRETEILLLLPFATSQSLTGTDRRKAAALISGIINDNNRNGESSLQPQLQESVIPWHISNKYYEANVHFRISTLSLSDASTSAPSKRKAIIRSAGNHIDTDDSRRLRAEAEIDADEEELKERVKDVFEALSQPNLSAEKGHHPESLSLQCIERLMEEIRNIDAVILMVDRHKSLSQHQALLDKFKITHAGRSLLSGFDLSISIAVAVSSPLGEIATSSPATIATSNQLSQLYAEEGWEYIDLEDQIEDCEGWNGEEGEVMDNRAGGEETEGIDRVREALETHAWPKLVRKKDQRRDAIKATNLDHLKKIQTSNEQMKNGLATLEMNYSSLDNDSISAEPTEQDEVLARAFLESILESQLPLSSPSSRDAINVLAEKSLSDLQEELETFLERKDENWPARKGTLYLKAEEESAEGWPLEGTLSSIAGANAFDDDFTDFVSADQSSLMISGSEGGIQEDPFDEDADLDLDEVALMRALESEKAVFSPSLIRDEDIGTQNESSLSAIVAQAERVRNIEDREKRRQEAARIALALVQDQP